LASASIAVSPDVTGQLRLEHGDRTDQRHPEIEVPGRGQGAVHDVPGRGIATHGIDRDPDHQVRRARGVK
jgi:hypothetical protein